MPEHWREGIDRVPEEFDGAQEHCDEMIRLLDGHHNYTQSEMDSTDSNICASAMLKNSAGLLARHMFTDNVSTVAHVFALNTIARYGALFAWSVDYDVTDHYRDCAEKTAPQWCQNISCRIATAPQVWKKQQELEKLEKLYWRIRDDMQAAAEKFVQEAQRSEQQYRSCHSHSSNVMLTSIPAADRQPASTISGAGSRQASLGGGSAAKAELPDPTGGSAGPQLSRPLAGPNQKPASGQADPEQILASYPPLVAQDPAPGSNPVTDEEAGGSTGTAASRFPEIQAQFAREGLLEGNTIFQIVHSQYQKRAEALARNSVRPRRLR